ncbi:unnamed protein product [Ectocarpus sp. 13 AM-2016]
MWNGLYLHALYEGYEVGAAGANLSRPNEDKSPHVARTHGDPHLPSVYDRRACSRIDSRLHRGIEHRVTPE